MIESARHARMHRVSSTATVGSHIEVPAIDSINTFRSVRARGNLLSESSLKIHLAICSKATSAVESQQKSNTRCSLRYGTAPKESREPTFAAVEADV
jgi:hypothetical protein